MSKINDLFCTPEQGRRLAELVPDVVASFAWVYLDDDKKPIIMARRNDLPVVVYEDRAFLPALTLQELRDVVKNADYDKFKRDKVSILDSFDYHELENLLDVGTAPKLAAWVIERLEAQP